MTIKYQAQLEDLIVFIVEVAETYYVCTRNYSDGHENLMMTTEYRSVALKKYLALVHTLSAAK